MILQIADDALAPLLPHRSPKWPLERLVAKAIARAGHVAPADRTLVLDAQDLDAVEIALSCSGAIGTPRALVDRVLDWAKLTVGHVEVTFSPAEFIELERRAARMGISPQELTFRIAQTIKSQFFTAPPDMTAYAEPDPEPVPGDR